jgi:hypothetical protein
MKEREDGIEKERRERARQRDGEVRQRKREE